MDYSNVKNVHLENDLALDTIKSIIDHQKICMLYMGMESLPFNGVPMTVLDVDDQGIIWFFSPISSSKNDEIRHNDQVMLTFIDTSRYCFMTLFGRGFISIDRSKIEELWSPMANAWFNHKDDPNISLIGFKIENGVFQQSNDNKIVALAKLTISALLNSENNLNSTKGTIKVG